jgi:hypothetical protein
MSDDERRRSPKWDDGGVLDGPTRLRPEDPGITHTNDCPRIPEEDPLLARLREHHKVIETA